MIEVVLRPNVLSPAERREFCRKAKADRCVFEAAEMLAENQPDTALNNLRDAISLVGPERSFLWLRHYAVTKFGVAGSAVDALLRRVNARAA
ncbi:MAG TPA: hypothetical protein VGI40_18085 [Pirellulaceae bacterium]|jgi:hypothetical protein